MDCNITYSVVFPFCLALCVHVCVSVECILLPQRQEEGIQYLKKLYCLLILDLQYYGV